MMPCHTMTLHLSENTNKEAWQGRACQSPGIFIFSGMATPTFSFQWNGHVKSLTLRFCFDFPNPSKRPPLLSPMWHIYLIIIFTLKTYKVILWCFHHNVLSQLAHRYCYPIGRWTTVINCFLYYWYQITSKLGISLTKSLRNAQRIVRSEREWMPSGAPSPNT